MAKRSAVSTLRGYFYQFDSTILEILSLDKPHTGIVVEGIEDIDLESPTERSAIQCKYYQSTEYNHSVISKAIQLMLEHFSANTSTDPIDTKYFLRGHFSSGQHKLSLPLELKSLKENFLTPKNRNIHEELGLSDDELETFLSKLDIDIYAPSFDEQYRQIINTLQKQFDCQSFEAEYFYYNNALRLIKDLASDHDINKRKVTRKVFLRQINTSEILFNRWFLKLKGKDAYFRRLRKEYFTALNISPHNRFFLIEPESSYSRADLKEILRFISEKWSKVPRQPSRKIPEPFCPFFYFHNIPKEELRKLKRELWAEGMAFKDGYDFKGASFSSDSVLSVPKKENLHFFKILEDLNQVEEVISCSKSSTYIFQFFLKEAYFHFENQAVKHVLIQYHSLSNIKSIT